MSEQGRASHLCTGCGGSGRIYCECESDTCDACFNSEREPCPVCLGAGSFSDRMPARDAVADAETLRLFSIDCYRLWVRLGEAVKHSLRDTHRAARAAFRACPGLRGEK